MGTNDTVSVALCAVNVSSQCWPNFGFQIEFWFNADNDGIHLRHKIRFFPLFLSVKPTFTNKKVLHI